MFDTIRTLIPQFRFSPSVSEVAESECRASAFISRPIENQFIPRNEISLFRTRVAARTLCFLQLVPLLLVVCFFVFYF